MEFLHRGMFCLLLDLVGWMCASVYPSTHVWFSVSRSFTVGNGVRADILRGRRGRAGGSGGSRAAEGFGEGGRAGERAGGRTRADERGSERESEQAAPGSARLPQAAGREGVRGRGGRAAGTPGGRDGPRAARLQSGRAPRSCLSAAPGERGPDSAPRAPPQVSAAAAAAAAAAAFLH